MLKLGMIAVLEMWQQLCHRHHHRLLVPEVSGVQNWLHLQCLSIDSEWQALRLPALLARRWLEEQGGGLGLELQQVLDLVPKELRLHGLEN